LNHDSLPQKLRGLWPFAILICALLTIPGAVHAQVSPGNFPPGPIDPLQRSGDDPVFNPLERPNDEKESPIVPSPPLFSPGAVDTVEGDQSRVGVREFVVQRKSGVEFDAETERDISVLVTRYQENKAKLSLSDLQTFRQELTLLIASPEKDKGHGYVNSGARLLEPGIPGGVATFEIVGGEIDEIYLNPTQYFAPFYLRQRLSVASQTPFNIHSLQHRLQRLLQTPGVARVNTEIQPGSDPGQASLAVNVEEKIPFFAFLEFNNFQNPSVGAERGLLTLLHQNFLGFGDAVSFTYGRSNGTDPLIDVSYTLPFTPGDTTLQFRYRKNDTMVVENPFDPLNIELDSDVYSVILRQPYYFNLNHEVALSFGFEHLRNKNFLLGQGFPFFAGATSDGEQVITALRFGQEWLHRGRWEQEFPSLRPVHVVSFRSRLSWGIDALGATINPDSVSSNSGVPSGRFFPGWVRHRVHYV